MPVDERSRHQLFRRLEGVLGAEDATTLIEYLPPVSWADVATRRDLDVLESRILDRFGLIEDRTDARFTGLEERTDARFTGLEERFDARFTGLEERTDARFTAMDARFTGLEERFDARFTGLEERTELRFAAVDERFNRVDERFGWLEERLDQRLEATKHEVIGVLHRELNAQTKTLMFGIVTIVITMATLAFALVRFT